MGRVLSRVTWRGTATQIRHVTPVRPTRASGPVARVYAQVGRDFGMLAPPVTLHAAAPEVLAAAWLMLRETLLASGRLPRATKEAVAVAVSLRNACPYCVQVHGTALHGLAGTADARAVGAGRLGAVTAADLRRAAAWARSDGAAPQWPAAPGGKPPAPEVAELVGTAVTFHYLNRMVTIFLVEAPIPPRVPDGVRRAAQWLLGRLLRPLLRRPVAAGGSLDLLPAAPLPLDLRWAGGSAHVAGAFARAAAAIEVAGRRSVPEAVRDVVAARLSAWDGAPPGPSAGWAADLAAGLRAADRPVARLALLAALAPYQVGPSLIGEVRRRHPDDRSLIEVSSWASLAAARWWGARLCAAAARAAGPAGAQE